jgi:hypothetical protein
LYRRPVLKLFLALYIWSAGELAWACSCFGGLFFDDQVKQSSIVLLGRVRAQGSQEVRMSTEAGVAYLDVEVIETFKGKPWRGWCACGIPISEQTAGVAWTLSPLALSLFSLWRRIEIRTACPMFGKTQG